MYQKNHVNTVNCKRNRIVKQCKIAEVFDHKTIQSMDEIVTKEYIRFKTWLKLLSCVCLSLGKHRHPNIFNWCTWVHDEI